MHFPSWATVLLVPVFAAASLAAPHHQRRYQTAPTQTIFQLDRNGTWIENLAVRCNGDILATRIDSPEVWTITPSHANTTARAHGSLLYRFPNAKSTMGIVETRPDVFGVIVGNVTLPSATPTPGSFSLWTIDLTTGRPNATLVAAFPEGQFLDGLTKFSDDLLLITDATKGNILRFNLTSLEASEALVHPSMPPAAGQPVQIGVNGIKVLNGYVYYTSSTQAIYARVPVDETAATMGPVEIIASGFTFDEFVLLPDGTAYLSTNPQNEVIEISPQGRVRLVAGNMFTTATAGSTAVTVSRDLLVLYVGTSGAQFSPVLGTIVEPAKVAAVVL